MALSYFAFFFFFLVLGASSSSSSSSSGSSVMREPIDFEQQKNLHAHTSRVGEQIAETTQQIAELSSGVTQMRGQMDEITAVLRSLAAQRT